ncbi:hypothetical protein MIR68_008998 [Amoeboaphelidium protococcarum]|nr:hypothetical protein MIR68_008998 [Amoeboaphelidium protococcarum]
MKTPYKLHVSGSSSPQSVNAMSEFTADYSMEEMYCETDLDFECDAPKWFDFRTMPKQPENVDQWFDNKMDTPLSQRLNEPECLYVPGEDSVLGGSAYGDGGHDFDLDSFSTPSKMPSIPEPGNSNNNNNDKHSVSQSTDSRPSFASETKSFASSRSFSLEELRDSLELDNKNNNCSNDDFINSFGFDDDETPTKNKIQSLRLQQHSLLKNKPFSPIKPSRLFKSTTAEDFLSSEESQKVVVESKQVESQTIQLSKKYPSMKTKSSLLNSQKENDSGGFNVEKIRNSLVHKIGQQDDNITTVQPVAAKKKVVTFMATKSVKPLTVPVEFNFTKRDVPRQKSTAPMSSKQSQFQQQDTKVVTAQQKPQVQKSAPKLTKPKPFKFHSVTRATHKETLDKQSPYVPLAECVKKFEATPARFKSQVNANNIGKVQDVSKKSFAPKRLYTHLQITHPKSPKFLTDKRLMEKKVVQQQQCQQKKQESGNVSQLAKPKVKKFKSAAPLKKVNQNVSGLAGVPRVKKQALTIPKSPNITKPSKLRQVVQQPQQSQMKDTSAGQNEKTAASLKVQVRHKTAPSVSRVVASKDKEVKPAAPQQNVQPLKKDNNTGAIKQKKPPRMSFFERLAQPKHRVEVKH